MKMNVLGMKNIVKERIINGLRFGMKNVVNLHQLMDI